MKADVSKWGTAKHCSYCIFPAWKNCLPRMVNFSRHLLATARASILRELYLPSGANRSVNHPIEMGGVPMKRLTILMFVLGASVAPACAQSQSQGQKPLQFHGLIFRTPEQVAAARAEAAARAQAPSARISAAAPKAPANRAGFHGLLFQTPEQVAAARAQAPSARVSAAAPKAPANRTGFHGLLFQTPEQVASAR
jgi:hypothetical protein